MLRYSVGFILVLWMVSGCSQQESSPQIFTAPTMDVEQQGNGPAPAQQPRSAVIWVRGLSCPLCVQAVRKELQQVRGVEQVDVNLGEEYATVNLSAQKPPTRQQLVQAIERSGYMLTKLEMR